ncbi:hypothetical protein LSH36_156g12025 [Paralvinella palmiformis]|uniref:EF-hand domain-containing protein n=1 Tax=Paralvinella palmiformis TaxID=53620 RepID=A0AAD9JUC9_9ANNE|nr:hypothetical protein LSH36_156g12025 [Paralvinella palmiformis]
MGYGYKRVTSRQLMTIVDRLTVPTRASISWRYDYDAQGENLKFLKSHDPDIHPARSCTPDQLDDIIERLVRPTTASTAAIWNFDNQDANLAYLKIHDSCLHPINRSSSFVCLFQDGYISFREFISALSVTSRGSLDEKLDFSTPSPYSGYKSRNKNRDGKLTKDEFREGSKCDPWIVQALSLEIPSGKRRK